MLNLDTNWQYCVRKSKNWFLKNIWLILHSLFIQKQVNFICKINSAILNGISKTSDLPKFMHVPDLSHTKAGAVSIFWNVRKKRTLRFIYSRIKKHEKRVFDFETNRIPMSYACFATFLFVEEKSAVENLENSVCLPAAYSNKAD
jgi:hypothetical protein